MRMRMRVRMRMRMRMRMRKRKRKRRSEEINERNKRILLGTTQSRRDTRCILA